MPRYSTAQSLVCLLILTASFFVYYPGINGPFVFDDFANILNNHFIQIDSIDLNTLYHSSFSMASGPLQRPVVMASFALNYYFGNGLEDTAPFKITNIIIHSISAILLFIISRQLYRRSYKLNNIHAENAKIASIYFAGSVSLIWVLHPINLTSVLYVVQRMTSLSGLFSLASISCYLYARELFLTHSFSTRNILFLLGSACFAALALYSKENAILLPLFILLIELTLYSTTKPWSFFQKLGPANKLITCLVIGAACIGFFIYSLNYAAAGYGGRSFTLIERLMTESRVLCFYISLIFLPRINAFGLHHDDIQISTSLLNPITTIPSIIFLAFLILTAIHIRKRYQLACLGILWFFTGHLLESTIFPLEIAHEHRNYLPSAGLIIAAISLILNLYLSNKKRFLGIVATAIFISGGTTWLRASEWADFTTLAQYEALHHPNSPSLQTLLGKAYYQQGDHQRSAQATLRAYELNSDEAMYLINLMIIGNNHSVEIPENTHSNILDIFRHKAPTPSSQIAVANVVMCLETDCPGLKHNAIEWLQTILGRIDNPRAASVYQYLLGKAFRSDGHISKALNAFQKSHDGDPKYLHPLIEMTDILIGVRNLKQAEMVYSWLESANENNPHPQDAAVNKLRSVLDKLGSESGNDQETSN